MATVTHIKTASKPDDKGKYRYAQALPHELGRLVPLITAFYKEIGFTEAAEKPLFFIKEIQKEMFANPYSIFYVCVDENINPVGYMWFRIDRNPIGQAFVSIEHDYIIPELRKTYREGKIQRDFINYVIEIAERCDTQYVNAAVRTKELEKHWAKLGFKPIELKMTYKGTANDFKVQNPSFQEYGSYEDQIEEVREV